MTLSSQSEADGAIKRAYADYTTSVSVRNAKVACGLVIVLVPAGISLDWFVYPEHVGYFFKLRLLCSALTALVFWALRQEKLVRRFGPILCTGWYVLPAFFISWMIAATEGTMSPYYAGLNLVILAVSSVIQATLAESIVAVSVVFTMYIIACLASANPFLDPGGRLLFNNFYFISLTAIIVVTGNYFFNRLRYREFVLRHELDESRRQLEEGNRKLEEGNQKLKEMDKVKSRFFANMSHELRTPLTLLIAPLETILTNKSLALDGETRDLLQTMHANGMRLLKLINDLLDLEKLESGRIQIKRAPLSIPEFLRGLVSAVQGAAQDKRLKVETAIVENVTICLADRDKLERIVLNLLFNAIKFTPAGGRVTVRAERREGNLILQVQDTGMGIAETHLPFIFDRFWQADSSAQRKHQGTGIGLALVKELVEAQHGKVTAQSQLGKGTTMTVQLPYEQTADLPKEDSRPVDVPTLSASPEFVENRNPENQSTTDGKEAFKQASANGHDQEEWLSNLYRRAEFHPSLRPLQASLRREETVVAQGGRPKVLVADDEPDMLRFLTSQLAPHFHIYEAVDGQQAIDKASQFLPDLIVLDMMMPEKDGLEVCRELRAKPGTQNIPIILVTARADEETKLTALSAGASDFLSKPFSTTELHVRVKNLIEQRELQRKLARQNQILEGTLEQLKEAQAMVVQSEKLAGLGRMSAGIIHEINNPLNFTKTGLYTLRKKEKLLPDTEREDFNEIIRDIEEGVDRVKTIVSDLRSFTHPNTESMDAINLDKVITSTLRLLSDQLKPIRVEKEIPKDFTIPGNENKLVQVFINLLQNSIDAMKKKKDGQPVIAIRAEAKGGLHFVKVRDNGEGIAPENLGNIFDPFFTTKDVGEGMGLGLSICYRIVAESGGIISVKSEPGAFTEFTLEFPENISNLSVRKDLG